MSLVPWVEKYRPQRLEDVVGNEPTIKRLKVRGFLNRFSLNWKIQVLAQNGNIPNIIISVSFEKLRKLKIIKFPLEAMDL